MKNSIITISLLVVAVFAVVFVQGCSKERVSFGHEPIPELTGELTTNWRLEGADVGGPDIVFQNPTNQEILEFNHLEKKIFDKIKLFSEDIRYEWVLVNDKLVWLEALDKYESSQSRGALEYMHDYVHVEIDREKKEFVPTISVGWIPPLKEKNYEFFVTDSKLILKELNFAIQILDELYKQKNMPLGVFRKDTIFKIAK
ncbi:MAG: hypothetical protein ACP5OG_02195 [Candidatus Nanoarchaeia archaeon]